MTVISLLGLILACPSDGGSSGSTGGGTENQTPKASDYNIDGTGEFPYNANTSHPVTVTAKSGFSTGTVTVKYTKGNSPFNGIPKDLGVYVVTFDVAAATGWNAVSGLSAGIVYITGTGKPPLFEHFNIVNLPQDIVSGVDTPKTVSITALSGYTAGTINWVYTNVDTGATVSSPAFPTATGTYKVVFTVEEDTAGGWESAFFAAPSVIIRAPGSGLEITELTTADFSFKVVTGSTVLGTLPTDSTGIEYSNGPQTVRVDGATSKGTAYLANPSASVTVRYSQTISGVTSVVAAPTNVGTYDVVVTIGPIVNSSGGSYTGIPSIPLTLKILQREPKPADFDITNNIQAEASLLLANTYPVTDVVITPKTALTPSLNPKTAIKIYYDGRLSDGIPVSGSSGTVPQIPGSYVVTFDVDDSVDGNWKAVTGLAGGTLEVKELEPVLPSFVEHFWFDKDVLSVSSTAKRIKPGETITFRAQPGNYTIEGWQLDGKPVEADDAAKTTYTFRKTALGYHWVTLVVRANNNKLYSETVEIRVQTQTSP